MADTSDFSGANVIEVCSDGPLVIHCEADLAGETLAAGTALCRCGHSSNKPYCDGSHNTQGFSDQGAVEHKAAEDDHTPAPLKIRLAPNGPILCAGSVTIKSADGASTHTAARASLCRCGQSTNKPFCDGTHGKVGFTAE